MVFRPLTFITVFTLPSDLIKVISQSSELELANDPERLAREAIPFEGQLQQHKTDPNKVFLLMGPLTAANLLVEFKIKDILYAQNTTTLTGPKGDSVQMVKLWVRTGAVGVRLTPFVVADFSSFYQQHLD